MMRECFSCKAGYHWLSDNDYNKLMFQVRSRVNAVLKKTYDGCGYQSYNDGVCEVLMDLIEKSWKRVRGKETQIVLLHEERYLADD